MRVAPPPPKSGDKSGRKRMLELNQYKAQFRSNRTRQKMIKLPKSRELRKEAVRSLFMAMDPDMPKMRRIASVSLETGLSYETIETYVKESKWEEEFQKKKKAPLRESSVSIHTLGHRGSQFADIRDEIKDMGLIAVSAHREAAEALAAMVIHYSRKMKAVITKAGGIEKLTTLQETEIELYSKRLNGYLAAGGELMKPTTVARYLQIAGIETALNALPDDIKKDDFTPQKLQELLTRYGMRSTIGSLEVEDVVAEAVEGEDVPEIDARKVREGS